MTDQPISFSMKDQMARVAINRRWIQFVEKECLHSRDMFRESLVTSYRNEKIFFDMTYVHWQTAVMEANYHMVIRRSGWDPELEAARGSKTILKAAKQAWVELISQTNGEWHKNGLIDSPFALNFGMKEEVTLWVLHLDAEKFDFRDNPSYLRLPSRLKINDIINLGYRCGEYRLAYDAVRDEKLDSERGKGWRLWLIDKESPGWLMPCEMYLMPAAVSMYYQYVEYLTNTTRLLK